MLGKKAVSTGWSNLRYIKDNFHDPCYPLSLFNQNDLQKQTKQTPPGGVYSQKNWVGVCGPLSKTLTLFMTRICDIPYPIYDLTFKSKP